MDTALSIALGIGLSAAAGFRVFVPMLALSIAALSGNVELSPGFAWIGTIPALVVFATATVLEILAYIIPWVDNMMDSVATPAAVIAGVVATASVITDLPPLVQGVVALIAGGGAAGLIQGATSLLRLKSTVLTGGLANPVLAAAEFTGSVVTSILALIAPLLTVVLLALLVFIAFRIGKRFLFGRQPAD
jgi:hypothetical protein